MFGDFNGLPETPDAKTEFYQHDAHWSNRMILGDSLQVMASLAEREGLRGKVQCIYFDPPYGIKFNSNFQWSTTSRDVKDGKADNITREPEQVKAFRDTWRDGIHSYLTYLRDRLTVARDLLTESGSIFVQIGDENVHRVRAVMDEVFGETNFVSQIVFTKTTGSTADTISAVFDTLLWYAKSKEQVKARKLYLSQTPGQDGAKEYRRVELEDGSLISINALQGDWPRGARLFATDSIVSKGGDDPDVEFPSSNGIIRLSCKPNRHWKPGPNGIRQLWKVGRLLRQSGLRIYKRYFDDFPYRSQTNIWTDTRGDDNPTYVVQTDIKPLERCILMTTDPGDLVLDPTMGSGTTAYVAEQWGRRWITIDTSRVAMALARARIMGARYPYYLLADSPEGQQKEAEVTRTAASTVPTQGNIRRGFVYERVPHITLKSIANNTEIDVIWDEYQEKLEPIREKLNKALSKKWEEWEVPRDFSDYPQSTHPLFTAFWDERIARQKAIDASIAARADVEYLYDKPYENKKKVRVAGPFTVESLSPHRMLTMDENDNPVDTVAENLDKYGIVTQTFDQMILENLRIAGVQQAHKEDKINFTSLTPWPGEMICAEGRYSVHNEKADNSGQDNDLSKKTTPHKKEQSTNHDSTTPDNTLSTNHYPLSTDKTLSTNSASGEVRAAIFIGPEYGTITRVQLVDAAKEAGDAGFDVLITCGFAYEAHTTDFSKLGKLQVLKARMNADLHMATDLKNTGKGNLFVIFGEPDITINNPGDNEISVTVNGVDIFKPSSGEVVSSNADGIACWFVDTNYNEESFFVRQAYFLGANDPYKSLKTTLKAEIDLDAWESLHSDTSRPFPKPETGKIAVKVINHLGDEVMKVFRI